MPDQESHPATGPLAHPAVYQMLFEECPVALVYQDLDGTILKMNQAFSALTGHATEYALGKTSLELNLWSDTEERERALSLIRESGLIENFEATMQKRDGSTMLCELSARIVEEKGQPRVLSVIRDITKFKKAQTALENSEALFREFFNANPVATIITSPTGTVHLVNPAFCNASGYSAQEVTGRTSQELGFWKDPEDRQRMVSAIQEHGFIDKLEAQFYAKNNRPMTIAVSSRAVMFEGELRILNILLDMTETRSAEKALKNLNKAKSDFISTAAHELRTPLIAVIGYAELLQNALESDVLTQQMRDYVAVVLKSAETLNRLVDDMMDIDRIQRGQTLQIVRSDASIAEILDHAIRAFTLKAPTHDFRLVHRDRLPEHLSLDSNRISQVLNNLLENAVKYSAGGTPVEITTSTDKSCVSISIRDHGVGMNREQLQQIYDKFYRANPEDANTRGLGLGMCIVKQILDDHTGTIDIVSTPDIGTTVTFTLPV